MNKLICVRKSGGIREKKGAKGLFPEGVMESVLTEKILPSVVFGIVSIVRFIKLKRRGVKSVATLVLGIISLAMGVSAFFSGIMFAGVMEAGDNEIRTALNGVLYSL